MRMLRGRTLQVKQVDVAIIGAGSAGMRAYREASLYTNSIALIEDKHYGTTCARVGCMPSKLLIAAADAAMAGIHAKGFGIHYSAPEIDGQAVMKRVRDERDRFVGFVKSDVNDWPKDHLIWGKARFKDNNTLSVDDALEIKAKTIIIATGSSPNIIDSLKNFKDKLIINDDIFDWQDLPQSVAVIGTGVIGLELGQALHRLGVRVTIFGRSGSVGPLTDEAVIEKAHQVLQQELNFKPFAKITEQKIKGDKAVISYQWQEKHFQESFDYVLAATGRKPNVFDIGLENTNLPLDENGVPLYDLYSGQIADSAVFIAGDVNNRLPLLHEASDEGMIAGFNAAHFPQVRRYRKSSAISVVFSCPQIMMVGESYQSLVDKKSDFAIGQVNWQSQGRSRVMLINKGLLRVYGDKATGTFLGAEMIGPRAEHIAHLLAWAHQSNLTVSEMLERPFYHPVFEEGVRTALRELNFALKMGPKSPPRSMDCGPGA